MTHGLSCPRCGCGDLRTTHTIRLPGRIKRRKVCRHCGRVITTRERVETQK